MSVRKVREGSEVTSGRFLSDGSGVLFTFRARFVPSASGDRRDGVSANASRDGVQWDYPHCVRGGRGPRPLAFQATGQGFVARQQAVEGADVERLDQVGVEAGVLRA